MGDKRVLYISGSFGLGHITRDLAIATELRALNPKVELYWLAGDPARQVLRDAGEHLLPEAELYGNDTEAAESAAQGQGLNIVRYTMKAGSQWAQNVAAFRQVTRGQSFDLVVADEAYEIEVALLVRPSMQTGPFVIIYDFLGLDATTSSIWERLGVFFWNRIWSTDYRLFSSRKGFPIFVGELEDVPDSSFAFALPNRRRHARAYCKFVGYILPFQPADYSDTQAIKARLGYGEEPLVVCSIGGTSIGRGMLELCGRSFPMAREKIPNLRMVLVAGPRVSPKSLDVPDGVQVAGYVPKLFEHFAASDLAVVQAGGTTTLELTALRRPFLYFPVEGQCEQEMTIAPRLARHRAGVRMHSSHTTPRVLADQIVANLGETVNYPSIPTDGAKRAAELLAGLLGE